MVYSTAQSHGAGAVALGGIACRCPMATTSHRHRAGCRRASDRADDTFRRHGGEMGRIDGTTHVQTTRLAAGTAAVRPLVTPAGPASPTAGPRNRKEGRRSLEISFAWRSSADLLLQRLDPRRLLAARAWLLTRVDVRLLHPRAQRLNPMPSCSATRWIVPSSRGGWRTIRTAWSFSAGEYRRVVGFPGVRSDP
jgi:hypothetical protein